MDELEWRSPEWINQNGLRTDNVLEYLSQSPFWDRQCNNQMLKMQRQALSIPTHDPELARLQGVEYVLVLVREPDLWVVRKQRRRGGQADNVVPLATYFVVGSSVFMSGRVGDVVAGGVLSVGEGLAAFGARVSQ